MNCKSGAVSYTHLDVYKRQQGNNTYKWDMKEETIEEIKAKKKLYTKWMSTKKEEDYRNYREKNKEVKEMVSKEKNEAWKNRCRNVDQYIGGARSSEA